jgi:hypothetical protein
MLQHLRRTTWVLAATLATAVGVLIPVSVDAHPVKEPPQGKNAPCATRAPRHLSIQITSPKPDASISLASSPVFAVTGRVDGDWSWAVRGVELYADGKRVGAATRGSTGARSWTLSTSAPAGRHTVVACAWTWAGALASASVTFTVVAPPAAQTIVAPDVVIPPAAQLATITGSTTSTVTFSKAPAVQVGQVLVAGVTATTPDGLLRRVSGVRRKGSSTVLSTVPAAITEVLWQADITASGVPLVPPTTPGATTRGSSSNGTAVMRAASLTVQGGIDTPTLARTISLQAKVGTPGVTASGSIAFTGTITAAVHASLDYRLKITPHWSWTKGPSVSLDEAMFRVSGTQDATFATSVTGTGKLQYRKDDVVPAITLSPIVLSDLPPIVLVPRIGIDAGVSLELGGGVALNSTTHNRLVAGFDYKDHRFTSLDSSAVRSESTAPLHGSEQTTGKASVFIEPKFLTEIDAVFGPAIRTQFGLRGTFTAPCPGSATLGVYGQAKVSAELAPFGKTIAKTELVLGEVDGVAFTGPFFGCDAPSGPLTITSTVLGDAVVGVDYGTPLTATGGTAPYSWKATGLPPGLVLREGVITGKATTPGSSVVSVSVTDATATIADVRLPITVISLNGPSLDVAGTSLHDGVVGLAYTGTLSAVGGSGPYTWKTTAGTLPDGISLAGDGTLSGTPTTTGTATITIEVTDAKGATAARTLTLTVDASLPDPVQPVILPAPAPAPVCGGTCGSDWGDPHLHTFDNATYDFQQVGEFIATKSTLDDFEVQIRQRPWGASRSVAVNSAVAMRVAGHRVGLYLTDTGVQTLVDGAAADLGTAPLALPGGGTLSLDTAVRRVIVTWPDGSFVAADYVPGSYISLDLSAATVQRGHLQGLLGDADGTASNDLVTRAGAALPYPATTGQLYGDYSAGWRLTPTESLFDYPAGQSTGNFTDPAFPYLTIGLADLPAEHRDAALAVCRGAGVQDTATLNSCALDVAVSGDPTVAAAAVTAQSVDGAATGATVAASGAGEPWTDPAGNSGTTVLTYGHLGCTAVDVKGACTGGAWPSLAGASWIWAHQLSLAGQDSITVNVTITVTAAQAAHDMVLSAACDDAFTAVLNGEQVLTGGFPSPVPSTIVHLKEGTNTLSIKAANLPGFDPQSNPGGLIWKLAIA